MKVLVPYDGSQYSLGALRWIANMALDSKSEIVILHVVPNPIGQFTIDNFEDSELRRQSAIAENAGALNDIASELALWQTECKIRTKVRLGHVKDCILEVAHEWDADLIVLATHEYSAWGKLVHKSVSQEIFDAANCSVLIVKPTQEVHEGTIGQEGYKVLLPIQGSFYSSETISWLYNQTWRKGTQFKLFMVVPEYKELLGKSLYDPSVIELSEQWDLFKERAFEMLEQHALNIGHQVGNENVSISVEPGDPKHAILEMAQKWSPDIIALGSKGPQGLNNLIFNSVPSYIASHCNCSVLVVKRQIGIEYRKKQKFETISLSDLFSSVNQQNKPVVDDDWKPHNLSF